MLDVRSEARLRAGEETVITKAVRVLFVRASAHEDWYKLVLVRGCQGLQWTCPITGDSTGIWGLTVREAVQRAKLAYSGWDLRIPSEEK